MISFIYDLNFHYLHKIRRRKLKGNFYFHLPKKKKPSTSQGKGHSPEIGRQVRK